MAIPVADEFAAINARLQEIDAEKIARFSHPDGAQPALKPFDPDLAGLAWVFLLKMISNGLERYGLSHPDDHLIGMDDLRRGLSVARFVDWLDASPPDLLEMKAKSPLRRGTQTNSSILFARLRVNKLL